MLKRDSVQNIASGRIDRQSAYLVVVMRYYPRFLKRELIDEYVRDLAPPENLFKEFKETDRKLHNHNSAFYLVNYEARFDLDEKGREQLKRISQISAEREVVLVCQCRDFDRCHADLLLLWAQHRHGAKIGKVIFDYPVFQVRLRAGKLN